MTKFSPPVPRSGSFPSPEAIPVTRTFFPDYKEYERFIGQIWERGQITNNGLLCQELETRLKARLQVPLLSLVSNGTVALQLAIKGLDLKGEIITTPYSYVATTNSILWEGCEPVFVDICPESFCINPELIEAAITDQTSAILATHVYGYPCHVKEIEEIAAKYNIKVIYDAAHAFGVTFEGRSLLTYGDCSTLSFHATKLFHTGEGGAVVCRDEGIADRVSLMSKFGHTGEDNYLDIGINAKMSELHAAMGLAVLPRVEEIIAERRQCSMWYDEYLGDALCQRPAVRSGVEYNYSYYPVIFPDHATMMRVRQVLIDQGIFPRRYFYPSLNTLPFLNPGRKQECPVSESIASRVLCLPLFVGLGKNQIEKISRIVHD